jgi:hypothetical protein
MIRSHWLVAATALVAAAVPFLPKGQAAPMPEIAWPASFEGRPLKPLAPAPEDARLARDFPGRIARFDDGKRQVVLRRVASATRQLHPAHDCFHAIGYAIAPLPMRRIVDMDFASCFEAKRRGVTLHVCERIIAADGRSFADVSSWYWPALMGQSTGPWLAATTVERVG